MVFSNTSLFIEALIQNLLALERTKRGQRMNNKINQQQINELINQIQIVFKKFANLKNKGLDNLDVELFSLIGQLSAFFDETFKTFLPTEMEGEKLSYDAAIQYLVNNRPDVSNVAKGAILRQPHERGYSITQVFLDNKNQLVCMSSGRPYGRRLIVQQLDPELTEAFDNEDLIIVE